MTGEMVGSEEALRLGLVNDVVEPEVLETRTMEMAENIARKSPYTIKVAKRAVRASLDLGMSEGILGRGRSSSLSLTPKTRKLVFRPSLNGRMLSGKATENY